MKVYQPTFKTTDKDSYVPVSRAILEEPVWTQGPFDDRSAYMDVAMRAQFQDYDHKLFDGPIVHLSRGQFFSSRSMLKKRWSWKSTGQVLAWEERMVRRGLLRTKPYRDNNKTIGMVYEVVDYDRLFSFTGQSAKSNTGRGTKPIEATAVLDTEHVMERHAAQGDKPEQNNNKVTKAGGKSADAAPGSLQKAAQAAINCILNGTPYFAMERKYQDNVPEDVFNAWSEKHEDEVRNGRDAIIKEILTYRRVLEGQ